MSTEDDVRSKMKATAVQQQNNSSNAGKYSTKAREELDKARRLIRVILSRDVPKDDIAFRKRLIKLDDILAAVESATGSALVAFETHHETWRTIFDAIESTESDTEPDSSSAAKGSTGTDDRPKLNVLNGGHS